MKRNLGESVQDQRVRQGPKRLRVVLADDDHDSVLTLLMLFREEGDEVRGVYSGRNVMGTVLDFDPDRH